MSSHHFVRDGQEPALLVLDRVSWEIVGPLLEWAPLVVVAEGALDAVLPWGIKIDAVITSPERIAAVEEMLTGYGPVKILPHAAHTDPLITSLDYLTHAGQSAVNITSTDPSPLAATISKHAYNLNISIITPTHHWSFFKSGAYRKWLPAMATLQIHEPGAIQEITTPTDGLITLNPNPPFWISETL